MTDPSPRVVCFDLGGVVIRICRTWEEGCERAGVVFRGMGDVTDLQYRGERHRLTDEYMSGRIPCLEFFRGVAQAMGGVYTPEEVRAVHDAWVLEDYPGMRELIEELNGMGTVATACLSNTNHAHWEPLSTMAERSPAIWALQTKLVSHEMGAVKPDERIYAMAEERLGASGAEIVFFDDLPQNVEAASARGWRAFAIDHEGDPASQVRAVLTDSDVMRKLGW